jgi:hypothetical protein
MPWKNFVPISKEPAMTPDPLPPDLLALERELAARWQPEPPADLRSRVLAAAGEAVTIRQPIPTRIGFAGFAAATAAAALLAINLSASVANDTDWRLNAAVSGLDVAAIAAHVRTLNPDFSDGEAIRQAILLRTAAGLTPAPMLAPSADELLSKKELD